MAQCTAKSKRSGERCKKAAVVGRNVCHIHGGKTPGGIAAAGFKHGRYSKHIPKNLSQHYQELLNDPDILSLQDDVALLRSMVAKHLQESGDGDTHPAWLEVRKAFGQLEAAIDQDDTDKIEAARQILAQIIEPNYRATLAEDRTVRLVEKVGSTADKERRLVIDRQKMLTIEQGLGLITMIIMSVRESVQRHCDADVANRILYDTQAAYSRAVSHSGIPETTHTDQHGELAE